MWKNPFRKQTPRSAPPAVEPAGELTLKARVAAFWQWYASAAERLHDHIENKRSRNLDPEVSPKIDELLPGMAWVFGRGEGDAGHNFTLTPEGDPYKRFVAQYWLARAPRLAGWTFYAARQPGESISGQQIRIGGKKFDVEALWLTPRVDEQKKKVDLTLWHPLFGKVSEDVRETVACLWLDEALGEDGAVQWIGEIKLGNSRLANAFPLAELPQFIAEIQEKHGWTKHPLHDTYCLYNGKEPERGGPLRTDVIAGTSRLFSLIREFPLDENPLEDFGADLVMVVIPTANLPSDNLVDTRAKIEDAIIEAFDAEVFGFVLGGATGIENLYIDLLLCDGGNSRAILSRVLAEQGMTEGARVVSFVQS